MRILECFSRWVKFALIAALLASITACGQGISEVQPSADLPKLSKIPSTPPTDCGEKRAKLYDVCSDQKELFEAAKLLAKTEGKTLLVSYGAEWCIWCHVFDKYVQGYADVFTYTYGEPGDPQAWTDTLMEKAEHDAVAEALTFTTYFRENFVIFHLEASEASNGEAVMYETGASEFYDYHVPFIFTVDTDGQYVGQINSEDVQVRRDTYDWYRGYDRPSLMKALKSIDPKESISRE